MYITSSDLSNSAKCAINFPMRMQFKLMHTGQQEAQLLPVSTSSMTVGLDGSNEVAISQCGGRFESSISSGKYVTIIGNGENPSIMCINGCVKVLESYS